MVVVGDDVCVFGYECYVGEDDVVGVWFGGVFWEFVGVVDEVCVFDDFVLLVVVFEDDNLVI